MKTFYKLFAIRIIATAAMIGLIGYLNGCASSPATYSAPEWAPATADAASVPYYYFPDYGMYYDAAAGQYYYLNNGAWLSSATVPYSGVDLNNSYVVMLNRNTRQPWLNHEYYERNYPAHAHEQYEQIVRNNNAIPGVAPQNRIVTRAYNENNDHVIFEERSHANQPGTRVATHEIPMQTIAPNMPPQARQYKYGGANRGR